MNLTTCEARLLMATCNSIWQQWDMDELWEVFAGTYPYLRSMFEEAGADGLHRAYFARIVARLVDAGLMATDGAYLVFVTSEGIRERQRLAEMN